MTRGDWFSFLGLVATLLPLFGPLPAVLEIPNEEIALLAATVAVLLCIGAFCVTFALTRDRITRSRLAGWTVLAAAGGILAFAAYVKLFVDWFPRNRGDRGHRAGGGQGLVFAAVVAVLTLCMRMLVPQPE